jgi:hypothetical protein
MASIVSTQLDEWAAAGPINLAAEGKSLSFEFSTKLLVSLPGAKGRAQDVRGHRRRCSIGSSNLAEGTILQQIRRCSRIMLQV